MTSSAIKSQKKNNKKNIFFNERSEILLDIADYFCILEAVFNDKTKDVRT